jgi:hypothetical protein
MDAKQSIQEPYSCSSIQGCASVPLGRKPDDNKLEFGNEKPVKVYHVLCRDLIDCGTFGGAGVGSKENGQGVRRGMAG